MIRLASVSLPRRIVQVLLFPVAVNHGTLGSQPSHTQLLPRCAMVINQHNINYVPECLESGCGCPGPALESSPLNAISDSWVGPGVGSQRTNDKNETKERELKRGIRFRFALVKESFIRTDSSKRPITIRCDAVTLKSELCAVRVSHKGCRYRGSCVLFWSSH